MAVPYIALGLQAWTSLQTAAMARQISGTPRRQRFVRARSRPERRRGPRRRQKPIQARGFAQSCVTAVKVAKAAKPIVADLLKSTVVRKMMAGPHDNSRFAFVKYLL